MNSCLVSWAWYLSLSTASFSWEALVSEFRASKHEYEEIGIFVYAYVMHNRFKPPVLDTKSGVTTRRRIAS